MAGQGKTVMERLRQHAFKTAQRLSYLAPARLAVSEWSETFEQLMRNRLIMGAIRYGKLSAPRPKRISNVHIGYIEQRTRLYKETGNTELLVDIANLCLVEFEIGDHPKKHFKAIDRED